MSPTTSLVVPSFQGAHRLDILLRRLSEQRTDHDFEAVVVLDGSTDGSAEVVERWVDRVPVRCVDLGSNHGRSAALNAGFRAATGDVLVRCDDDLAPRPDFVERHTRWHLEHGPVGVIGLYRNVFPDTAFARLYGRDADRRFRDEAYRTPAERRWQYWAGNCSVSRDSYERVGAYDEDFREYGWEDVDWGYRLHLAGVPVILDPELETDHHIASTTTAIRIDRAHRSGVAKRRFLAKFAAQGDPVDEPVPSTSTWNRAVSVVASQPQRRRASIAGLIDSSGAVLPSAVGRRAIALLVESSGRGGAAGGD